ncbi:MAG: DNA polymerase III subunit gamma/tau [Bacteroidales bacterium]|nr:DNA polymerase III subunit gamma/tau [Bacteroidales bacterium]
MEQYIVSARKYRPDSFETLIGQDNIAKTLKNSIVRGQLAHAYLFCGPRGVGKTSAARIFAKTINCSNPSPDMEPCGECESCRSFAEGRSYCIHELDAASNNSVDDIKMLIDQVNIPPQIGRYSVYIVDEVHMLSQAAFNAFLKTLEEPPSHAIFILATTEKHKILPTILSRCQTYDFNRISVPDMVRNLRSIAGKEGITIDDESLHVIALKADGAMRDALTIFDQTVAFCGTAVKYEDVLKNLNVLGYEHSFFLVDAFLEGRYRDALLKFDEILSKGFNALHFVAALSSHLRDLLVAGSDATDALLELPDSLKKRYREQAARCSVQFLYDALAITTACESGYRASINPRLHIEFALMRLSFLCRKSAAQAAAAPAAPAANAPAATASAPAAPVQSAPVSAPAAQATPTTPVQASPAAAQSAEAPAEPARARRPRRTPSALSLNAIKEQGVDPDPVPAQAEAPEAVPSDEAVLSAWKTLPAAYSDRPRLAGTLSSSTLELEEKDGTKYATFYVVNAAQQQWIQEKLLHELEGRLQKAALSRKVRLLVSVQASEQVEEKPYLPKDQALELMANNPEVKNLVSDLGLDTKF